MATEMEIGAVDLLGFEKVPNFGYTEVLSDSQYV